MAKQNRWKVRHEGCLLFAVLIATRLLSGKSLFGGCCGGEASNRRAAFISKFTPPSPFSRPSVLIRSRVCLPIRLLERPRRCPLIICASNAINILGRKYRWTKGFSVSTTTYFSTPYICIARTQLQSKRTKLCRYAWSATWWSTK